MSREGNSPVQTPRSTTSLRTIQRRNRLRRLQALPADGRGKKLQTPGRLRHPTVRGTHVRGQRSRRKGLEVRSDVRRIGNVPRKKEAFNRSRLSKHALQNEHQGGEVAAADPAVYERRQPSAVRDRIERPHERRGPGPHHGQERFNRVEHARDPSEGQAGRAEADDLAVLRRNVAPDDVHGIAGRVQVIERAVEPLEGLAERTGSALGGHRRVQGDEVVGPLVSPLRGAPQTAPGDHGDLPGRPAAHDIERLLARSGEREGPKRGQRRHRGWFQRACHLTSQGVGFHLDPSGSHLKFELRIKGPTRSESGRPPPGWDDRYRGSSTRVDTISHVSPPGISTR